MNRLVTLSRSVPRRAATALVAACCLATGVARAAEMDGVRMPDSITVAGVTLHLNGIGVRTVSIFQVHVYIAGLYLERRSRDWEEILNSPTMKVLRVQFVHDASARQVRQAWQDGFDQDCPQPCHLPADLVARFLAATPDMHVGDVSTMVFTREYASISVNGKELGRITDPLFNQVILATFIGPHPPTERLKRELLAGAG